MRCICHLRETLRPGIVSKMDSSRAARTGLLRNPSITVARRSKLRTARYRTANARSRPPACFCCAWPGGGESGTKAGVGEGGGCNLDRSRILYRFRILFSILSIGLFPTGVIFDCSRFEYTSESAPVHPIRFLTAFFSCFFNVKDHYSTSKSSVSVERFCCSMSPIALR